MLWLLVFEVRFSIRVVTIHPRVLLVFRRQSDDVQFGSALSWSWQAEIRLDGPLPGTLLLRLDWSESVWCSNDVAVIDAPIKSYHEMRFPLSAQLPYDTRLCQRK